MSLSFIVFIVNGIRRRYDHISSYRVSDPSDCEDRRHFNENTVKLNCKGLTYIASKEILRWQVSLGAAAEVTPTRAQHADSDAASECCQHSAQRDARSI